MVWSLTLTIDTFHDIISQEVVKETVTPLRFLFSSQISHSLFIHTDQISPMCVWACLCIFMLCITNTCWGMLPSNPCPALRLSRCVFAGLCHLCIKRHARTHKHTPASRIQWTSHWALCSICVSSWLNMNNIIPACVFMLTGSSYLVAGEDERSPDEKSRHSLCRGGHEEDGLVWAQQWGFREPWNVGARRGCCWWGGRCRGQRRVLPQPLWERHVSSPQPQHLDAIQKSEAVSKSRMTNHLFCVCACMKDTETQTMTMLWWYSVSMNIHFPE